MYIYIKVKNKNGIQSNNYSQKIKFLLGYNMTVVVILWVGN